MRQRANWNHFVKWDFYHWTVMFPFNCYGQNKATSTKNISCESWVGVCKSNRLGENRIRKRAGYQYLKMQFMSLQNLFCCHLKIQNEIFDDTYRMMRVQDLLRVLIAKSMCWGILLLII